MRFIPTQMTKLRDPHSRQASPRDRRGIGSRWRHRGDEGITMIEALVAIALLGIIVAPIANLVIETGQSVNQSRLRLEAYNLATQTLESVENGANFAVLNYTKTTVTVTLAENGGNIIQPFAVTTAYDLQAAGGQSLCSTPSAPSQIWKITVQVGWPGDEHAPAQEVTYIAPDQAGAIPELAGELIVPVDSSAAGNPLLTSQSVPVTVVGTWSNGAAPQPGVPGLEVTQDTENTGTTGCAVFSDLDPATGWTYMAYLGTYNAAATPPASFDASAPYFVTSADVPGIVNGNLVTNTTPPATPPAVALTPIALTVGTPREAPAFYVDPGTTVPITWSTYGPYPLILPASNLPVTAVSTSLSTGSFPFDTFSVGGATINSVSLYPYSNYTLYAGDTADSNPNDTVSGVTIYPTAQPAASVNISAVTAAKLYVYPVMLKTAQPLIATEVHSPGETVNLNWLLTISNTGLPLGQYALTTTGGVAASPPNIWVTPTGVYYGTGVPTVPTGFPGFAAAGTAITVTP
jgi:Tfp pilus assembly protein PilV